MKETHIMSQAITNLNAAQSQFCNLLDSFQSAFEEGEVGLLERAVRLKQLVLLLYQYAQAAQKAGNSALASQLWSAYNALKFPPDPSNVETPPPSGFPGLEQPSTQLTKGSVDNAI